jgi:flagellar biosynthesis protein FliQ
VYIAGPLLALALGVGLFLGIIPAATSINEMTLSFVPKVIIVLLGIGLFGNFLMMGLTDYFAFIFDQVAGVGQN